MTDAQDDLARLIRDGRDDIAMWAAKGFGVFFHDKQIQMLEELDRGEASYYVVFGGNRAGKTLPVIFKHLHLVYYKIGLPPPSTQREYRQWLAEDYRTLHCAPTNGLVSKHWAYTSELLKGTHPAQRDDSGKRRDAPLGAMFTPATESIGGSGEHLVIRSLTGGTVDMYSTEGNATRIESVPWRFGSWDEWPLQESADKGTAIRLVLDRLSNRLSDFDGKLLLTGTLTEDTEHIGRELLEDAEDPDNKDWAAIHMSRLDNPYASRKAIGLAERNMTEDDYKRTVLGEAGGVKGRIFPSWMVDPAFTKDLPRFTPPAPDDGAAYQSADGRRGRFRSGGTSPWSYYHLWDIALSVADNVGLVLRVPADLVFSPERPIVGVRRVVVPGSRTLTSAEIIHTIEEVYLPYGGQIVVDATDAHGKNIARELRKAGYPVEEFVFNERDSRRVIRKDAAIIHAREILSEGMAVRTGGDGQPLHDADGVPVFDHDKPYGAIRLPRDWTRTRDQIAVLREDDDKQRKDEAMAFLMGCDVAWRARRSRTRTSTPARLAFFAGSRTYGRAAR